MPRTADAKPAQIVKCPHCDWKGSARGLFGHVKLSHPGNEGAIKHSTKRVNPYAVSLKPSKTIGKASNKPLEQVSMQNLGIALLVGTILKLIEQYYKTQEAQKKAREEFIAKFQREAQKPNNTHGVLY
jgi:hypothetical protein